MAAEEHNGGRSPSNNPTKADHSLDDLARDFATGNVSRGRVLKIMGGALLGSVLAAVPGVAWANDCRRLGRECRRDSQCCSKNCVRRGEEKVCGCPTGQTRCNDRCVNLQRNERHCGSCFNRCAEGEQCVNGTCCPNAQVCGIGTTLNCCAEGEECVGGVCQGVCPPGRTLTEGDCNCSFRCNDPDDSPFACQNNPNCLCGETTEGTGFCVDVRVGVPTQCSTSTECQSGWKCIVNTCFPPASCAPPCSTSTGA